MPGLVVGFLIYVSWFSKVSMFLFSLEIIASIFLLLLNMKLSFLSISAFRTMAMTVVGADKTERKTTHDNVN